MPEPFDPPPVPSPPGPRVTAPMSWRDHVDELLHGARSPGRLLAGALLVIGVAVAGVALLRPAGASPPPPELSLPMASSSGTAAAPASRAPADAAALLVVHAAGAVVHPGLYRVAPGSRVDDLLTAAGGLAADADGDRINLAAPLSDGERVFVPRVGQPVPADADGGAASSSAGPLDLNTATEADLDALPGIGPSTAQAILAERTRRGGRFSSVDDLLDVRGIGPAKLDELRSLVTVG